MAILIFIIGLIIILWLYAPHFLGMLLLGIVSVIGVLLLILREFGPYLIRAEERKLAERLEREKRAEFWHYCDIKAQKIGKFKYKIKNVYIMGDFYFINSTRPLLHRYDKDFILRLGAI